MMDNIFVWMRKYDLQIAWFLIGLFSFAGLEALKNGDIVTGLVYFGFAAINYFLARK